MRNNYLFFTFLIALTFFSNSTTLKNNQSNNFEAIATAFLKENKKLVATTIILQIILYYGAFKEIKQRNKEEKEQKERDLQEENERNKSADNKNQQYVETTQASQSNSNSKMIKPIAINSHDKNNMIEKSELNSNDQAAIKIIDIFCDNIYQNKDNAAKNTKTKAFLKKALLEESINKTVTKNNLIDNNNTINDKQAENFFNAYEKYTKQFTALLKTINEFFFPNQEKAFDINDKNKALEYLTNNIESLNQTWKNLTNEFLQKRNIALPQTNHRTIQQPNIYSEYNSYYQTLQDILFSLDQRSTIYSIFLEITNLTITSQRFNKKTIPLPLEEKNIPGLVRDYLQRTINYAFQKNKIE